MKLYNTLSRKVDNIQPINPPAVTVYTCGPTVYDYPHIGNWFTFVRYDLLVRALKSSGMNPKWVINITDVGHLVSDADEGEDKLEKGARREGLTAWEVADYYGNYFVNGLEHLNISQPDFMPKATEHIQEQIDLISKLEAKGLTYKISDGVYYDTSLFTKYGDFARLDVDEQQAGARVEYNQEKRNITDFALWKLSPEGQKRDMEWDSPWGRGFPGWHIECSAMSMKYLGDTIDIHAGGIDHIPVHHTNEIAQSEPITGKPFANYWMHTNHISVNGDKISKSLGNGVTLEEIEQRGFSPMDLRLHILESHYRSQSKFSWDSLQAAKNRLRDYRALADLRFQVLDNGSGTDYEPVGDQLLAAIADDLNTPELLRILSELANSLQTPPSSGTVDKFIDDLAVIDSITGLKLTQSQDISEDQKELIRQRSEAKNRSDWVAADQARDNLLSQGIGIRDTSVGPIWYSV